MKLNEKKVEELLKEVDKELKLAYGTYVSELKDLRIQNVKGKIEALLTIIDFE